MPVWAKPKNAFAIVYKSEIKKKILITCRRRTDYVRASSSTYDFIPVRKGPLKSQCNPITIPTLTQALEN